MSDELLRFYNSELQYIRRLGDQFAEAHPQIASHLRFGSEGDYDPYVGRMVQAFAYLNARTRQKLEDEFPEIAASYLDIMLPHFQRPIPSACVVRMNVDESQAELYEGYEIKNRSVVETAAIEGEPCLFRTCFPVTCWPFQVSDVSLRGVPFDAPEIELSTQPLGMLQVSLKTFSESTPFSRFEAKSLRFFIRLPPPFCFQLYELLFDGVLGVTVASSPDDPNAVRLPEGAIRPVGYAADEGLVDYPPQSFPGYRLLSEYFAFPEKFLFMEVDLSGAIGKIKSPGMNLYFYLRKRWKDLEPQIKADVLQLGCTPAVNLFSKRAEPIRLTHFEASYPVVPDARRPVAHEVYSIDSITGVSEKGERKPFIPFYSFRHGAGENPRGFWHASRRELQSTSDLARGTEMDVAFVDLDFNPLGSGKWTMDIETTCTNRNLPARMPFGGSQPTMQLAEGGAVHVRCMTKPTVPLRPKLGPGTRWRLVSHLALNHLSLVDDAQGATAMRELLTLYDLRGDEVTASSVAGLQKISSKPLLGRVPGDRSGALCRGISVSLVFDEDKFSAGNLFLFASVLDRFIAMFSSINSITQVSAWSNKRQGALHQWPVRAGIQNLA